MARFRLNHCIKEMQAHEKAIAERKAALNALFEKRIDLIHEVRSLELHIVRRRFHVFGPYYSFSECARQGSRKFFAPVGVTIGIVGSAF